MEVNGKMKVNMEFDTYYHMYYALRKEAYLNALKTIHKNNVKRIRNQEKIKIAFQINSVPQGFVDLIKKFMKNKKFEVSVVLTWLINSDKENEWRVAENYLKMHGIPYFFAGGDIVPAKYDVIFFTSPYLMGLENWHDVDIPLSTLCCYMYYGFCVEDIKPMIYNLFCHNMCWLKFAISKADIDMTKEYCDIGLYGTMYSGDVKMDALYTTGNIFGNNHWKIVGNEKDVKKIIFAPHHSISEAQRMSTFPFNYKFFLEYAKNNPETTSWIFKPHPLLRMTSVKNGVFSSLDEYYEYCQAWNDLPNAQYIEDEFLPWFVTSDCMIFDSMSFLAAYLYVHKPFLFLTRESINLNEFGHLILENSYSVDGSDFARISEFIENCGTKYKFNTNQQLIYDRILDYYSENGMTATNFIYKTICNKLRIE